VQVYPNDEKNRFLSQFHMNAGECIVFDSHRIVHGRETFSAKSGTRHLRDCYTNRGVT
jgi:gamma-butyrobetaine dioxygenase